jgi:hypothetical protein
VKAQRAYYDWVRFNAQHWADFHHWMHSVLKARAPSAYTHAKIMVFFALDRDKLQYGVDPELFCDATDLAGCDNYANLTGGEYAYEWRTQEMLYDLLHSFHNQPVFNSENHIIPDGSPPNHIPPEHDRAALWQGALHHQGATTIWVWEENKDPALAGSIYFRPANIYGASKAMLDLNRLGEEVSAIERATPRVAMLYSMNSGIWEEAYKWTMLHLYAGLNFSGEAVTFVSENQLAQRRAAPVQWIIVPAATHVTDATVTALHEFVARGGKVVLVGDNCLKFNEYHVARELPMDLKQSATLKLAPEEAQTAVALRDLMMGAGVKLQALTDVTSGKDAWGVEYRVVPHANARLVPMINLTTEEKTVSLQGVEGEAMDLISGSKTNVNRISLKPMQYLLLRITP